VAEANLIPHWVCSDWTLYRQILFHLIQNAIKFNSEGGSIKIVASYHSFEEEFSPSHQESNDIAQPDNQGVGHEPLSKIDEDDDYLSDEYSQGKEEVNSRNWGYILTQIVDTGEGIKPKDLKDLF